MGLGSRVSNLDLGFEVESWVYSRGSGVPDLGLELQFSFLDLWIGFSVRLRV